MAYILINRVWHDEQVPLLRVSLSRPRAEARMAWVGGLTMAKPHGNHGDLVVTLVAHHGGATLSTPMYVSAKDARTLLLDQFDTTPTMLDHLLSDAFAQRRYDVLQRHHAE